MGAHVFRQGLLGRMADIQTAKIDSNSEGNAFFQSSRNSLHGDTPQSYGKMGW